MPTYEYECQKCGHTFDLYQSIKEPRKKTCPKPKCRGRVKRLIGTGAGLLFKGSGFYITDYRKPGYSEAAKKDSPSNTEAAKTDKPTTTDSKIKKESAPEKSKPKKVTNPKE